MRKTIFDDGFQAYLTEGATIVGAAGIPMLMDLEVLAGVDSHDTIY